MGKSLPTDVDSQTGIQKKSRKKSRHTQSDEGTTPSDPTNVSSTTIAGLPKKTPSIEAGDAGGDDDGTIPETPEQRKARKKALKASRGGQSVESTILSPTESAKKGKKRKHRTDGVEDEQEAGSTSAQLCTVEGPPKKKHKNRTEFADPREDTDINNQSRKALEYAFTQMNRPSKWKFNKARQNWLIRNIWAPEALPDIYFPLAVKYLAAVQGGSREKLTQTCQSYLKGEEIIEKKDEEKTPSFKSIGPTAVAPRSILKPTPGPLIDLSPASKPVDAVSTPAPIPSSIPVATIADIRRARAQVLLAALGSSSDT